MRLSYICCALSTCFATQTTRVILFHKPVGIVTTHKDELGRETVIDCLRRNGLPVDLLHTLSPIGRLDKDTSGLLLLTNDGLLVHHVTNPTAVVEQGQKGEGSLGITKEYRAKCMNWPSDSVLERLRTGVDLGSGLGESLPADVEVENNDVLDSSVKPKSCWLRITIAEGRNRQIRRMLHAVGHGCMALERIRVGGITLTGVPQPGDFRELSRAEIRDGLGFDPRVIDKPYEMV